MPDQTPAEAPPAVPGLRSEAALIIGVALAALNALLTLIGAGGLDDGFQLNPDGVLILGPVLGALGIRQNVYSQDTVDKFAPRSVQQKVISEQKSR